jgi:hypothetical protein
VRPILKKKPKTKQGWWNGSSCRPGVQTPILQKKKKISWFCNYTVVLKFVIIKRSRVKEIHKLSVLFPNF